MSDTRHDGQPALLRSLGPWGAASIVVGSVIGSGIFLVPKTMINAVGTPLLVLTVFVVGGLLSLAGALTYAELGAALPQAGGEYVYLREAYGPFAAFLYGWTQFVIARSGSIAALGAAFSYYLANFWPALQESIFAIPLVVGESELAVSLGQIFAIALIFFLGWLNYLGVKVGGGVQTAVTVLKVVLILAIVLLAALLGGGSAKNLQSTVEHIGGVTGFFAALVAALWAYDGWNGVNMVSSEVHDPQRNIPRSLIYGVVGVMAIYLLTNVAYFYCLSAAEVAVSDRVASDAARGFLGEGGQDAVAIAAMISIFAALNGSILTGARVPYAMARDGYFFAVAGRVHSRYRSPHVAILALSVWGAVLVLTGSFEELFSSVIFASYLLYALTAASVFVLRRKRPDLVRPYRTLGYPWVPALFIALSLALVVATLIHSPRESIGGLGLISLGIPFYWRWRRSELAK
ncbi:MAG TPA: amino acid permease [Bryobacterales bacterium]|nr:amino acid permease [Bryobacterales bacterium]